MKLRNLAYAAMIAVAFTACSNGDDPIPTPEPEAGTTLAVSIKNAQTKADSDISSLAVIVADASGIIETVFTGGPRSASITDETSPFAVEQGSKQVMVIANVATLPTTIAKGQPLANVETALISMADEGESKLSMNSAIYTVDIKANTRNYLGYKTARVKELEKDLGNIAAVTDPLPAEVKEFRTDAPVKLYRNVAKVVINSIKMGDTWKANTVYPKPAFEVVDVIVVQTHKFSQLASLKEWGPTSNASAWVSPFAPGTFGLFTQTGAWGQAPGIVAGFSDFPLKKDLTPYIGYEDETNPDLKFGTAGTDNPDAVELYVYENTKAPATSVNYGTDKGLTLVSLRGLLSYNDANGDRKQEMRRFTFAVGVTGFWPVKGTHEYGYTLPGDEFTATSYADAGRSFALPTDDLSATGKTAIGALRNLKYIVDLTINGKGYGGGDPGEDPEDPTDDDPDPYGPDEEQFLDVTVKVVEWGKISQPVDVD